MPCAFGFVIDPGQRFRQTSHAGLFQVDALPGLPDPQTGCQHAVDIGAACDDSNASSSPMLNAGSAPHVVIMPSIMIVIVALAFTFIGDGLRNVLDPQGHAPS